MSLGLSKVACCLCDDNLRFQPLLSGQRGGGCVVNSYFSSLARTSFSCDFGPCWEFRNTKLVSHGIKGPFTSYKEKMCFLTQGRTSGPLNKPRRKAVFRECPLLTVTRGCSLTIGGFFQWQPSSLPWPKISPELYLGSFKWEPDWYLKWEQSSRSFYWPSQGRLRCKLLASQMGTKWPLSSVFASRHSQQMWKNHLQKPTALSFPLTQMSSEAQPYHWDGS